MWKLILVKFLFFIVGVVVGGSVVFGIVKLTDNSSSSGSGGTSNSPGSRANSSLKYVIAVSRHGNKGGSYDYPLDPYPKSNTDYWPYGPGQLTPHGRTQEYSLGAKLRSLYNGFLNTTFYVDDVFACTDLYQRTMMSGELVLAGLYPPEGWQVWNQNVNWQPIPLYTNSSDHTGKIYSTCPRFLEISAIMYARMLIKEAENITELIKQVYNQTEQTILPEDLEYLFEKLSAEETEGYTLPDWTASLYPSPLNDYYGKEFIASCASTDEVVRLWIGNLFSEFLDTLSGVVNGSLTRSLSYYSAHDVSLLNLQVALGIPRTSVITDIRTGSAIVIELHQSSDTNSFYIQVLYIDGTSLDSDPRTITLSDCGDPCFFDSFLNTTKRFTNVNYEEECRLKNTNADLETLFTSHRNKIHVL